MVERNNLVDIWLPGKVRIERERECVVKFLFVITFIIYMNELLLRLIERFYCVLLY